MQRTKTEYGGPGTTQTTEVRRHRDRRRSPVDVAEFFDRLNRRQPINQVGLTSQDLHCQQQSECLKDKPLGLNQWQHDFRGQNPQKLPKIDPNRHFPAKSAISKNHNISVVSERIIMPLPAVFEWDRNASERRSGPFKTTRLTIKLHQAYVLASEGLAK